ncbi:pyruvate kinase [Clostridium cavendishii DSM 21758]|uniref:Pyruvate kinase n=1 Tax=Clostridium cavendishii DSM 21758 TaxID=1121302 RepID=A0A1M6UQC4_9CLOT|nr:pyruvate kinase [Clostridium cavendishii]SHK71375.1 pyruvate kinase [Clostridium cavendishii DSM 21758]
MQKTKMIFTIGPASENEEVLREFIKIGMSAARLNFSHGTHETHKEKIELIKKLRTELNSPTAILLDVKGPKIRTHNFINDGVNLKEGNEFTFVCGEEILGDETKCSISYDILYQDIKVDGSILVDDGLLEFKVKEVKGKNIICEVIVGGLIKNHKGVNVPNVEIKLPAITEKDISDLIFGCEMKVDFVAASFIRKASDVSEVRKVLNSHGGENIKIISKIENQEGVDNIDSIIEVTDGVMVARGDMGVEIPIENVPIIQKRIIKKCNEAGKIVITATQMLDSMIRNSRPTRAEACDICNAIFDGTDAIMLSGESASGSYPIEAASTMSRIAKETEANLDYEHMINNLREPSLSAFSDAISYSAAKTAIKLPTKAIVAATQSGATARLLSKYKPSCPIIAITPFDWVRRSLALNFGVMPEKCEMFNSTDEIISEAKKVVKNIGVAETNETIIIAAGMPTSHIGGTNMFKIEKV